MARAAEAGGLDTVRVSDHLLQADPSSLPDAETLEAYTTLGFLAAHTERVRLGTMVSAVTNRPLPLPLKAVTAVDVLSGGRAWLGLGSGHHEEEARRLGLPLPAARERAEWLQDALLLAHGMWSDDRPRFAGRRARLEDPINHPLPLARRTRRSWSGHGRAPDAPPRRAARGRLQPLRHPGWRRDHPAQARGPAAPLHEAGRPYEAIEKTVSTRLEPDGPADAFAGRCARLAELGIEHAVVITPGPWSAEAVGRLAGARALLVR